MKRFSALILSAALIASLAGCGNREATTLLETDAVIVTHAGRITTVTDNATGEQYTFTQHRIKRPQNAAEAEQRTIARTAVDTDTITIQTVHDMLIVTVKDKQTIIHHYYTQP